MLSIVYRVIATYLVRKTGLTHATSRTGAVTLIQRFGGALNIHFHMLFLDGVYVDCPDGSTRFRWVKAPTSAELTQLAHTIAHRVDRFLERQGPLESDMENSYLALDVVDDDPKTPLLGHSITYRTAVGRQAGRRVFTLQTLWASDEPFDNGVGKVAGFSLHAGVAAGAGERTKLERLCRYISRPAVSDAQWQHPLPAQGAVPWRHRACHIRAGCVEKRAGFQCSWRDASQIRWGIARLPVSIRRRPACQLSLDSSEKGVFSSYTSAIGHPFDPDGGDRIYVSAIYARGGRLLKDMLTRRGLDHWLNRISGCMMAGIAVWLVLA